MQHVVLVTTSYPDISDGSEAAGSFVADFARELSRHIRVTVVAPSTTNTIVRNDNDPTVVRFAVPNLPLSLLNPLQFSSWVPIWRTLHAGRIALDRVVRSDRPEHILALWALPSGYWADQTGRKYAIPYSVWALGSDIWSLGEIPVVGWILRRVLQQAEHLYADGIDLAAAVKVLSCTDCKFVPSARILPKIPHCPRSDRPPYKLAYLGRWHSNKGVDLLFEALAGLDGDDWRAISEVRVYGGGPMGVSVHESAHNLRKLNRPVSVGGYLNKTEAARLIAWADYLLVPSRIESIPVVLSDAAQLGTPVIATPVGDLPRLREDHEFGILSDLITPSAFRQAIQVALKISPRSFKSGLESTRTLFDLAKSAECIFNDITHQAS